MSSFEQNLANKIVRLMPMTVYMVWYGPLPVELFSSYVGALKYALKIRKCKLKVPLEQINWNDKKTISLITMKLLSMDISIYPRKLNYDK